MNNRSETEINRVTTLNLTSESPQIQVTLSFCPFLSSLRVWSSLPKGEKKKICSKPQQSPHTSRTLFSIYVCIHLPKQFCHLQHEHLEEMNFLSIQSAAWSWQRTGDWTQTNAPWEKNTKPLCLTQATPSLTLGLLHLSHLQVKTAKEGKWHIWSIPFIPWGDCCSGDELCMWTPAEITVDSLTTAWSPPWKSMAKCWCNVSNSLNWVWIWLTVTA